MKQANFMKKAGFHQDALKAIDGLLQEVEGVEGVDDNLRFRLLRDKARVLSILENY